MAITITTEPQGLLLNAYNNSIIEFSTDIGTPSRGTIKIDEFTFEITPNQGLFYFNLKEIIKVLINQENFADNISVDNPINYLFPDNSLFLEVEFTITVFKTNGASESLSKTYKYIKRAKQLIAPIFQENDLIKILSPSYDIISQLTYFEGYPFDVSIYSNETRVVTLRHVKTTTTINLNLTKGVNRLFLSNGENDNLGFEEQIPLYIGVNELEIEVDASNIVTLFIIKKPVECGPYLKWFNQNGGWSYWKFEPIYREYVSTKNNEELNSDFKNVEETKSRVIQTGKLASRRYKARTGRMNTYERLVLSQIYTSPKVFIYGNTELQPFSPVDWKEVKIKNGNTQINDTKKLSSESVLDIELPKNYEQSYAG